MKNDGLIASLFFCFLIWFGVAILKTPGLFQLQGNIQSYLLTTNGVK